MKCSLCKKPREDIMYYGILKVCQDCFFKLKHREKELKDSQHSQDLKEIKK